MNILAAEDDLQLGRLIVHMLKKNQYHVEWVHNGEDALEAARASEFDVLILDWMMPGKTGIEVCRTLRAEGYTKAILILTARDSVEDRIQGLDAGADDYLVKPFEIEELLARLRALSRRNFAPIVEEKAEVAELILHRTSNKVANAKREIQLTPREFQLFDLLVRNKGQVLPRETILDRIWGYDAEVSTKTVDATVKLLRKKLCKLTKAQMIESVRGVGYRLED
ncbi:Two component transcriptional regulator, winged helix family protein [Fictibacillus macauensis ZFHKF-1]|uniref:Two component transcriptional regulator, winged helix family protein n=1 Tax=Fictibacillus macauensis ZFHKF-1 TaxID=1196324 RepID=I8UHI9_9BACL|nr:response regulator transcription factor [Fictibacillus macauensis]EIT86288.1 Two component transcriptional regulator, winged helix family protein [Fictibacillus macauensis ZFHKF-1]